MGQPIRLSKVSWEKGRGCVCLTFLVCVPRDCGQLVCRLALQHCNPPPEKEKPHPTVRLWHMHTGSVPQKYTHRHVATTELWSRSKGISCVWGATTGPHTAAGSYNPKISVSIHTDRHTDCDLQPSGLGVRTKMTSWTRWQVKSMYFVQIQHQDWGASVVTSGTTYQHHQKHANHCIYSNQEICFAYWHNSMKNTFFLIGLGHGTMSSTLNGIISS